MAAIASPNSPCDHDAMITTQRIREWKLEMNQVKAAFTWLQRWNSRLPAAMLVFIVMGADAWTLASVTRRQA